MAASQILPPEQAKMKAMKGADPEVPKAMKTATAMAPPTVQAAVAALRRHLALTLALDTPAACPFCKTTFQDRWQVLLHGPANCKALITVVVDDESISLEQALMFPDETCEVDNGGVIGMFAVLVGRLLAAQACVQHLEDSLKFNKDFPDINWNARLPGLNRFINCGKTKDVAQALSTTEDDWEPSCVDDGVRHDTPTTLENVPGTIDRLFGSAAAHGTTPGESYDMDASLGAAATDNADDVNDVPMGRTRKKNLQRKLRKQALQFNSRADADIINSAYGWI